MTRRQTPEPPPPLVVCTVCGGRYFNDQTGQRMHSVITGHQPEQGDPDGLTRDAGSAGGSSREDRQK